MAAIREAADLYGLPREDFTAARDEMVRMLRKEERHDEASRVSRMRKPTTDAWALNQVARRHPQLVEGLIGAHRQLRSAEGGDALRAASEKRRHVVDEILDAAAEILSASGHSNAGAVQDRITHTLLAAASDEATEAALSAGILERPAEVSALWPDLPHRAPVDGQPEDDNWLEEVERLEGRARELAETAAALEQSAREARVALDEARQRSLAADREAREAAAAARAAQKDAVAARRRAGTSPTGKGA